MKHRIGGILLHPTSLPGRFGIGDLGDEAIGFLDWLAAAGQKLWQILPLAPPGYGDSPYGSLSAFAGNPLLISPARLAEHGWIDPEDLRASPDFAEDRVDFQAVGQWKEKLFRKAWSRLPQHSRRGEVEEFARLDENAYWLDDFTLYMALKEKFDGAEWLRWDDDLVRRDESGLARARAELAGEIAYHCFVQFLFFEQWGAVRRAAHQRGIRIMGDMPIYVAFDSADVWSHPELFQLDEKLRPISVSGVPPDYFSKTGQRWGNPLYRWRKMKSEDYRWWVERMRANLRLTDLVRIDHFRGFAGYWAIPSHEETAVNGEWRVGPGVDLFRALERQLPALPIIAEDLGTITPDVEALRRDAGIPGMKVVQFAFGSDDNIHLPHHYDTDTVAYTGTHDNDTTCGWFATASAEERQRASDYFGTGGESMAWKMIRGVYGSIASIVIVPLQDVFDLSSEARMNTPGDGRGNWAWRAGGELFDDRSAVHRLRRLAEVTGRV
jgi:4-alpha-glucanotransferase